VRRAAKYFPYRWLLRNIDAHLYVGEANREYLRHYGVDDARLFFAPHFVDNDRFGADAHEARRSGAAQAFRRRYGIPEDAFLFLSVGKLIDVKRIRDFIEAMARIANGREGIQGAVVGAGPLQANLERLRDARRAPVRFLGFHNQSMMPTCYAAADALVLPSAHESWGLVVNEAMACGLPAVASDTVGAAPDLVAGTGRVFPSGNIARLADAMVEVHDQLQLAPDGVRDAVLRRISDYSCDGAVMGTLGALAAVTGSTHAHVQHV
jgi:glycosyltransferase involved in cell wall biosynthesis